MRCSDLHRKTCNDDSSDQIELRFEGVATCTVTHVMTIPSDQTELRFEAVATCTITHEMTILSDQPEPE